MLKNILFLVAFASFQSHSGEIDTLVEQIIVLNGVPEIVEQSVENHQAELLRVYNHISQENLNKNFDDLFSSFKESLLDSYRNAYRNLSISDLKRMVKFYKSDEGQWFLSRSKSVNDEVVALFAESGTEFNNSFSKRYYELYSVR